MYIVTASRGAPQQLVQLPAGDRDRVPTQKHALSRQAYVDLASPSRCLEGGKRALAELGPQ